jgi:shikimate kinase
LIERVVLVGFMGAGKSTVGPLLARALDWSFLDMDRRIEERLGMTVAECFDTRGEAAFRREELLVAAEAVLQERLVVAAGGGAFAEPRTREVLRQKAFTIWLQAPLAVLLGRLGGDGTRPLASNREIMTSLLAKREPFYKDADLTIDTSDAGAAAVADRLAKAVREQA